MGNLNRKELDFINAAKSDIKNSGTLNRGNHDIENKRYEKLSLSLTKEEKKKIKEFQVKNYPRSSISAMIMSILEEKGVFE